MSLGILALRIQKHTHHNSCAGSPAAIASRIEHAGAPTPSYPAAVISVTTHHAQNQTLQRLLAAILAHNDNLDRTAAGTKSLTNA
ncbi:hypothetical protein F1880_004940 [Penicillium rolfsii]|nr:hypothetical protein F1880_004940 [Penicillium rolfsii]